MPLTLPAAFFGSSDLAVQFVGLADHSGFAHRRVLVEHLLDDARVDVHAVDVDHVLLAVDDAEVAVVVLGAEIAGAEPLAEEGRPLVSSGWFQ